MTPSTSKPLHHVLLAAALVPAATLHAQTVGQSPQPGAMAAQPMGVEPAGQFMGTSALVPVSPSASLSQPFAPVSASPIEGEQPGLRLRARTAVEHDGNVLRTSAGQQSDTITTLGVGARYNQSFGQQRVVLDADLAHVDFRNVGQNFNTVNYAAAWNWRVGNQFEGLVSADRREFRDVGTNVAGSFNRRTERSEQVEANFRPSASLRVLGGLLHTQADNTVPAASWDGSPSVNSARVGVAYEPASGSSIALRHRAGDGSYRDTAAAGDFKERETDAVLRWAATAKTTVDARIGHLQREHGGGAGARDFSGMVGGINANWGITAKTSLAAGWQRDLGAYLAGTGGYLRSDRIFLGPVWRATELTAVSLRYTHDRRTWEAVTPAATADVGRTDTFNVWALGLDWQPRRTVGVGLQYRNEQRDSSLPAANYRANVLGVSVRLTI